jgi:hypothetical protein
MNLSTTEEPGRHLYLAEVAKTFDQVAIDVNEIIVLNDAEHSPGHTGFRIRTRDAHGPLPEIVVPAEADRGKTQCNVDREACKLVAVSRIRSNLMDFLPGSHFLPPATFDGRAVVGMRVGERTFQAEGSSFLEAYYMLKRQTLG